MNPELRSRLLNKTRQNSPCFLSSVPACTGRQPPLIRTIHGYTKSLIGNLGPEKPQWKHSALQGYTRARSTGPGSQSLGGRTLHPSPFAVSLRLYRLCPAVASLLHRYPNSRAKARRPDGSRPIHGPSWVNGPVGPCSIAALAPGYGTVQFLWSWYLDLARREVLGDRVWL